MVWRGTSMYGSWSTFQKKVLRDCGTFKLYKKQKKKRKSHLQYDPRNRPRGSAAQPGVRWQVHSFASQVPWWRALGERRDPHKTRLVDNDNGICPDLGCRTRLDACSRFLRTSFPHKCPTHQMSEPINQGDRLLVIPSNYNNLQRRFRWEPSSALEALRYSWPFEWSASSMTSILWDHGCVVFWRNRQGFWRSSILFQTSQSLRRSSLEGCDSSRHAEKRDNKKMKFKRWPKMGIGLNLRESDKLCAEECECSWDSK